MGPLPLHMEANPLLEPLCRHRTLRRVSLFGAKDSFPGFSQYSTPCVSPHSTGCFSHHSTPKPL